MSSLFTNGLFQGQDATGAPLTGGELYTYVGGTMTLKNTYQDSGLTTPNLNPVTLSSGGQARVWLASGPYRMILKSSGGTVVWDTDDVQDPTDVSAAQISALSISLAASGGAALIGAQALGSGAVTRTVQAKLREICVTPLDFGAVCDGVADDTAAALAAQAAAPFVFIPQGKSLYTSGAVNYWQFFGPGRFNMGGTTIEVPPFPLTNRTVQIYKNFTFGTRDNAVGHTISVNNPGAGLTRNNTQVLGATAQGLAQTSNTERAVVAQFIGAQAATLVTTVDGTTSYTSAKIVAPEITTTNTIPGMLINTMHTPTFYVGMVKSVTAGQAVVDGWFAQGSGTASTPANGKGAILNPTTHVWGQNILLNVGSGMSGTGVEIDVSCQPGSGVNTSVIDVLTVTGTPENPQNMFRARGGYLNGYRAEGTANSNAVGFSAQSQAVSLESRDATAATIQTIVSNNLRYLVNGHGELQIDNRTAIFNASPAYAVNGTEATIVNVWGGAVITMLAAGTNAFAGRHIMITAAGATTVNKNNGTLLKAMPAGTQYTFVFDGVNWH